MTANTARIALSMVGGLVLAGVLTACGSSSGSTSGQSSPSSPSPTVAASSHSGSPTSTSSAATVAMITIKNFAYMVPTSVRPDSRVAVKNTDQVAHTVTTDQSDLFDVTVSPGATARFTAPSMPGAYKFHCTFHSNMHGTLVVK